MNYLVQTFSDDIFLKLEKKFPSDKELYAKGDIEQSALFKRSYEEQFCQTSDCKDGNNSKTFKYSEVGQYIIRYYALKM